MSTVSLSPYLHDVICIPWSHGPHTQRKREGIEVGAGWRPAGGHSKQRKEQRTELGVKCVREREEGWRWLEAGKGELEGRRSPGGPLRCTKETRSHPGFGAVSTGS